MKSTNKTPRIWRKLFFSLFFLTALAVAARAQVLIPHFDCVEPVYQEGVPTGAFRAYFGYTNTTNNTITINYGPNSFISPNPNNQYTGQQTTVFQPGFHKRSFSIVFNEVGGPTGVTWTLTNRPVAASAEWGAFCGSGMITYQGRLSVSGATASQPHDFQFQFYDTATGGTAQGDVFEVANVPVVNGIFAVQFDVDYIFRNYTGSARFIEIRVRPSNASGAYTALAPRQQLTAAPFAINAKNVAGGKVQIPLSYPIDACSKPSDFGQIKYRVVNGTSYLLDVCTPNGWKTAQLQ